MAVELPRRAAEREITKVAPPHALRGLAARLSLPLLPQNIAAFAQIPPAMQATVRSLVLLKSHDRYLNF